MPTFPIYLLLTASESGCGILYSPWNFLGQNTGVGSLSVLQGIFPAQGSIESRSLTLQGDSLPAEPPGKPKNTGVGSLSLLQQIFLTQELNWGLLDSTCNAGNMGLIPGLGRCPGEGKGYPLQCSGLEHLYAPYSPWGHKELDTTERLSLSFTPSQCPLTRV